MRKTTINYEQLIGDLRKKIYHPVYLMTGEEPYYIDLATAYIMDNVLTEEEKAFNQTVFYGKDSDVPSIINTAKRFPMMANHQVIIVKEAQELRSFDDFIHYIEKPLKSTLLVINYKYKPLDKRKKIYKSFEQNAIIFQSDKLYEDKIPGWIAERLSSKNLKIEPKAAIMLTEFLGNDLSKINNEIEKLIITLPSGTNLISSAHVEKNIGISKEYNNYELQSALAKKDILKANRIINSFALNQKNNHITVTITSLFFYFSKILVYHTLPDKSRPKAAAALKVHPYFMNEYELAARNYPLRKVVEIISQLREYDLKSKGYGNTSTESGELLKELIYKILH
jgi:DNA polymerase III subunit delta